MTARTHPKPVDALAVMLTWWGRERLLRPQRAVTTVYRHWGCSLFRRRVGRRHTQLAGAMPRGAVRFPRLHRASIGPPAAPDRDIMDWASSDRYVV